MAKKNNFTDDGYNELGDLESYLDEISVLLSEKINQPVRELTETVDVLTSGVIGSHFYRRHGVIVL